MSAATYRLRSYRHSGSGKRRRAIHIRAACPLLPRVAEGKETDGRGFNGSLNHRRPSPISSGSEEAWGLRLSKNGSVKKLYRKRRYQIYSLPLVCTVQTL